MKKHLSILSLLLFVAFSYSCQTEEISDPAPVADELGGTVTTRKLSHYTEFFWDQTLGFVPQTKVRYDYNDSGKLSHYFVYGFDPVYKSLIELSHYDFTYKNNLLDKITGFVTGEDDPIVQYSYEYADNLNVSKIKQENYQVGINSEVSLNYSPTLNTVTAFYSFSNGGSFAYSYELANKNISTDKTIRGSELCNTGAYTYDDGINPFSLLGYTDFILSNVSKNNKLTESVDYLACSFPTLVPESYTHVYDSMGYPITSTTSYKSGGSSRKIFYYK